MQNHTEWWYHIQSHLECLTCRYPQIYYFRFFWLRPVKLHQDVLFCSVFQELWCWFVLELFEEEGQVISIQELYKSLLLRYTHSLRLLGFGFFVLPNFRNNWQCQHENIFKENYQAFLVEWIHNGKVQRTHKKYSWKSTDLLQLRAPPTVLAVKGLCSTVPPTTTDSLPGVLSVTFAAFHLGFLRHLSYFVFSLL